MANSLNRITLFKDKKKGDFIVTLGLSIASLLILVTFLSLFSLFFAGFDSQKLNFYNVQIVRILKFTIIQSSLSVFFSFTLGIIVARVLVNNSLEILNSIFLSLSSVAVVIPTVVAGMGIIKVWGGGGINGFLDSIFNFDPNTIKIYGLFGILLAHTFFNAPLYMRVFYNCFMSIPDNNLRNAEQLNIVGWNYFYIIEWPVLKSVISPLTGIIFLQCFTSFSLILMLGGGPSSSSLEVAIYTAVRFDFDLSAAAILSLIQLLICFLILLLLGFKNKSEFPLIQSKTFFSKKQWVKNNFFFKTFIDILWLILYSLIVFLPLFFILYLGFDFHVINLLKNHLVFKVILTSLILSLSSTILTLIFSWIIASARTKLLSKNDIDKKNSYNFKVWFLDIIIILYLALPAIVMGTGLFLLLRNFINFTYLPFLIVLLSNVLLCLPFTLNIIQSKMLALYLKHNKLCSLLGINGLRRIKIIDLPSLRPELGFAAGLSACFSIGDLSVIALFGNQNFQTIPWLLYQYMGSYQMKEAASMCLLLLFLCFIFFFGLSRLIGGKYA